MLQLFVVVALLALVRGSFVKFKTGVTLDLQPEMARALPAIEQAHVDASIDRGAFITSGTDGQHGEGSLHPEGYAVDLRNRDLTTLQNGKLVAALRKRLNGGATINRPYQVVVESTHIHVEYDPN
jgi:hypothetical protein